MPRRKSDDIADGIVDDVTKMLELRTATEPIEAEGGVIESYMVYLRARN